MYLQALEIIGFKSFAKKTRLVFEPGITAIVGPNGCGKSNVSDAIRWVLGEQRPTALRGGAMTDVIFSGTDDHKPLGMAEVSITFADCEKELGLEFNEVTVTRRVFRTGEGQYFINRNACRLRDIQRLFMDTGIGTTSYSVMAQGQIDAILSSRPEDRRAIFEEASGITRFRADRREALRKLEATDANLARLEDVIHELKRQIDSLRRQASRARRYKEMQAELRDYDLFLARRRLAELDERGRGLADEFGDADKEAEALRARVEKGEAALAEVRAEVSAFEQKISGAVETAAAAHHARKEADDTLRLNRQRIEEYRAWKERDEKEIAGTRGVRDAQLQRQRELASSLTSLTGELAGAQTALDAARAALDAVHGDSAAARAELDRLRAESVEMERTNARLQNELAQAEASARETILRNERLGAEKTRLAETADSLAARLEGATAELASLRQAADGAAAAAAGAETATRERRAALAAAQKERAAVRADLAACEARLKVLREAAASPDGLPAGTAKLLDPKNPLSAPAGAVLGPIADRFSAPKALRTALQAALRAWLDAVAVRAGADLPALLAALGKDPARLVAADAAAAKPAAGPANPEPPDLRTAPKAPKGAKPLLPLVKVDPGFAAAAERLLAGTFLVDSLPDDPATVPPGATLVTREGVVLRAGGLADVWGEGAAANPFSRHAQLEDAEAEREELGGRADAAAKAETAAAAALRRAEESLGKARAALDDARRAAAQKEGEERSLSKELAETRARLDAAARELDKLAAANKDAAARTSGLAERLRGMAESRTRVADAVAAQNETVRKAEAEFLEAQGRLTEARLAHAATSQRAETARAQHEAATARIRELDGMIATRETGVAGYAESIAKLVAASQAVEDGLDGLDAASKAADDAVASLRAARAERQAGADEAAAALQKLRAALDRAAARRNQAEVALAEARLQRQNLADGLDRDWHLTPETLAAEPERDWGEAGPPDPAAAAERVAELRRKMDDMGPVNLVAIEDCQKSEERHDFLVAQQKDLAQAKEKLLELIKDIDRQSLVRFRETFDKANANFQKMYTRLFGGGTAELRLLDDENILECGIDIVARPPGKKPTNISLLSGGERTMTAVALLFSIYEIKPSPFAILDELDAALDDSNIGRFVDVLKDFLSLSQFLIITHNQHTIAGSDIVYGVTQQEKGVSTIISMRLKRMGVEAPRGEELPAPDAPPPPGARKMRNAENYVKKPRPPKPAEGDAPAPPAGDAPPA